MNSLWIAGIGAVSPAGWSVNAMRDALVKGHPLPANVLPGQPEGRNLQARTVPPPAARPSFLAHPRLRRTSPITQFAVSAALEALGEELPQARSNARRLGIVLCVMAGCVNYSRRFYDETLRDPATASPIIFPETVFNAAASHLAAFLGSTASTYTLVGDPGMFLQGLALAGHWLLEDQVDACLVIGAEEADWLVAGAYQRFVRPAVLGEGAGALYLCRTAPAERGVQLTTVTSAHSFFGERARAEAALAMRSELGVGTPEELLCESTLGLQKVDAAERQAWRNWQGPRLAVKSILGEGLAAASAWQCVAAVDSLRCGRSPSATVSVVGCNQQAIGAQFTRGDLSRLDSKAG